MKAGERCKILIFSYTLILGNKIWKPINEFSYICLIEEDTTCYKYFTILEIDALN